MADQALELEFQSHYHTLSCREEFIGTDWIKEVSERLPFNDTRKGASKC